MYSVNIMVVEDEERIRKLIAKYLKLEGYQVFEAEDGEKALDLWVDEKIDLIILDVMLPKYDGWSVCRKIRLESDLPIIMLTARGEENDKIFGFELGVDDYVTKPFSPKELIARVKALLKRVGSNMGKELILLGNMKIDRKSHKIEIDKETIELTPKEYDLILYFIENQGVALSREVILDRIWGYDYYGDLRTVDTHIKRLRKKITEADLEIDTVRGVGYRAEVKK